ncbi:related to GTS1-transcription factor of the Gcs1p/Glo3p/Sps18p family [Phialocephala subalpina]|uniref:Related to GTS1-transcription factor of the Gcs1p/Glo3p/Sps18p family n=1 Tax=Phialocephala subalpina TaxID=576137 RepID=A0A1L7X4A5_9HELO|nr:related to GTS1-transcription factor of the Gcs1p/Glo3p/Sps18p family [Phialocephala subalpina]
MSGTLSKRQQARNERTLQDLIKNVPGNSVCADCNARNPGWASWSLGIFLCMRCAALHRKLGTHITKVKSLSMDSWSNEQVENMKRVGNVASNRIYNPQNARPPIPIDADEADSAMERFIRQKYQERAVTAQARNNTGSTNSDDQPPPLPPKTGSRFGFRSASSIFPLSSKHKREAELPQQQSPSPPRTKPSRIFGTSVGSDSKDDLELKMTKLRDMGFTDERRNMAVLKGLSGNLEKSIETLVRLGEGGGSTTAAREPSRSRTPTSAGISINRTRESSSTKVSTNPWEALDAPPPVAQPQSSQSTGSMAQSQNQMMGNNPYAQQSQNSNPFGLAPSQSQYNLNQAFQNMSVSSSQPPLFPHHTGGFPGPQPNQHQQLYQSSMTPPVPSLPQQYYPPVIYENSIQQPQRNNSYNPFMQQSQQPPALNTNVPSNPYMQQISTPQSLYQSPMDQSPQQQFPSSSPFYQNGAQQMNPYLNQAAQTNTQQQMNPFLQNQNPSSHQAPQQMSGFQSSQSPPQQQSQQLFNFQSQYRQQTMPLMAQPTGKADKRSILDLYNYPQLAPTPMQQHQQVSQQQEQAPAHNLAAPGAQNAFQQQQRSVSSPLAQHSAGSRNPFASSGGSTTQGTGDTVGQMPTFAPIQNGSRHVSQESMSIDTGGWTNGRHSPDAWGSISARSTR